MCRIRRFLSAAHAGDSHRVPARNVLVERSCPKGHVGSSGIPRRSMQGRMRRMEHPAQRYVCVRVCEGGFRMRAIGIATRWSEHGTSTVHARSKPGPKGPRSVQTRSKPGPKWSKPGPKRSKVGLSGQEPSRGDSSIGGQQVFLHLRLAFWISPALADSEGISADGGNNAAWTV